LYRVTKLLWPEAVEDAIKAFLIPVSLHVCSGHSQLGDIRLDIDENVHPHVLCDASRLWFVPADSLGRYKKSHEFHLVNLFAWQPRTYFGRGQFVSIFDAR
jgi:hypothetical protein